MMIMNNKIKNGRNKKIRKTVIVKMKRKKKNNKNKKSQLSKKVKKSKRKMLKRIKLSKKEGHSNSNNNTKKIIRKKTINMKEGSKNKNKLTKLQNISLSLSKNNNLRSRLINLQDLELILIHFLLYLARQNNQLFIRKRKKKRVLNQ